MEQAKSLSSQYGIPAAIPITDEIRYCDCDANEAILQAVSEDGKIATYKGVCGRGHLYTMEQEVEELRGKTKITISLNGEQLYTYAPDQVKQDEPELAEY